MFGIGVIVLFSLTEDEVLEGDLIFCWMDVLVLRDGSVCLFVVVGCRCLVFAFLFGFCLLLLLFFLSFFLLGCVSFCCCCFLWWWWWSLWWWGVT